MNRLAVLRRSKGVLRLVDPDANHGASIEATANGVITVVHVPARGTTATRLVDL